MKLEIEIEETISQVFKIEAKTLEDGLQKAEQMYRDAKLVLDNCQLLATRIRVSAKDGTKTTWQDV
ncbi:MAG: hypothetical protein IJD43_05020 [Thermoguttaceae bacterium]|nr:hypothetical protein [Thermoguttaceae bacterium]